MNTNDRYSESKAKFFLGGLIFFIGSYYVVNWQIGGDNKLPMDYLTYFMAFFCSAIFEKFCQYTNNIRLTLINKKPRRASLVIRFFFQMLLIIYSVCMFIPRNIEPGDMYSVMFKLTVVYLFCAGFWETLNLVTVERGN